MVSKEARIQVHELIFFFILIILFTYLYISHFTSYLHLFTLFFLFNTICTNRNVLINMIISSIDEVLRRISKETVVY